MIDLEKLVSAVQKALPKAEPHAAVPMLFAQLNHLCDEDAADLFTRILENTHPSICRFTDGDLDGWPAAVDKIGMAHVRSMPPGRGRIEAMCYVANRLTVEEQLEAFDGILDGTLPEENLDGTKPIGNEEIIYSLVRTLADEWKEKWLSERARGPWSVAEDRREVGSLDEDAVLRMYSEIDDDDPEEVSSDYLGIVDHLPDNLRAELLCRIRNMSSLWRRLYHLANFDDELTDVEREEVVETDWCEAVRDDPRAQADHLESVVKHLPKVSEALRQSWLEKVLKFPEDYDLQRGLMALLESLSGEDHKRAVEALVESVIRDGCFNTIETRWDLLPPEAFAPLLKRLKEDIYGWSRNQIIRHLIEERKPSLADECLLPLVNSLGDLAPDHCMEITNALTPWLAAKTNGMASKTIASLPVPVSLEPADSLYVITRVIADDSD